MGRDCVTCTNAYKHTQGHKHAHTNMHIPTAHLSGRAFSPASRPEKIPRECSGLVSGWVPATKSPLFSVRDDLARESSLSTEIDMSNIKSRQTYGAINTTIDRNYVYWSHSKFRSYNFTFCLVKDFCLLICLYCQAISLQKLIFPREGGGGGGGQT